MTLPDTLRYLSLSATDPRSDGELVAEFVGARDEAAFAELLRRHGPTVYGVCRRILGNGPDADDAFQAVFLVLARKANAIRPLGMVGNWLYGVAVRTANKARVMNARRMKRDRRTAIPTAATSGDRDSETLALIDAELAALPAVYRAAFVACDINGRSRSQAARELGWPEGTVAARLAKALELLAARLRKRGVTLGATAFAAVAVPTAVSAETLMAVRELLAVGTASAVVPVAQQLSEEVVKAMTTIKWKLMAVGLLALSLSLGSAMVASTGERPGPRADRQRLVIAPLPRELTMEWKEAKPILFDDGGRVTSVVYSPSGKSLAVCRDSGKIDFFDPMTRKHLKTMDVAEDGTTFVDKTTTVGTITAIGFRPTPHEKLGDVFAVTHKNGFKVGTTTNGLVSDPREQKSNGLMPSYRHENCDPHQVVWLEEMTMAWTNGVETQWTCWNEKEKEGVGSLLNVPSAKMGQPVVLAAIPGKNAILTSEDLPGSRDDKRKIEFGMNIREAKITIGTKDAEVNYPLLGHKSRPIGAVVAKDGKRIVSADAGGTLIVWEGEKFEFKETRRIELGHGVLQLALAPDGRTVAVVRTVAVEGTEVKGGWRVVEPELHVFDVTNPPAKPKPLWTTKIGQDWRKIAGPVSLAFSPDGKSLLAAFGEPYNSGMDDKGIRHTGIIPGSMGVKVWELVPNK